MLSSLFRQFADLNKFQLQPLPTLDLDNGGVFRAWWFDPLVASISFAGFIHWYWYHEQRLRAVTKTATATSPPVSFLSLNSMPVYAGVGYWVGIFLWRMVVPPAAESLPDGFPIRSMNDFGYLSLEIVCGIFLYDFLFFWIHLAMHKIPILRQFHALHHLHTTTMESRHVLHHSFVDASLQVFVNIMVQRHTPWGAVKSRLARALHNVLVIWFLTESHTSAPTPYIWRRWFVGVREHRFHHLGITTTTPTTTIGTTTAPTTTTVETTTTRHQQHHQHRYQQFFGYLDYMLNIYDHSQYEWSFRYRYEQQQEQSSSSSQLKERKVC